MQQSTSPPQYGRSSYSQRLFAASRSAVSVSTDASTPHSRSELSDHVVAVHGWPAPSAASGPWKSKPPGRTRRRPTGRRGPAARAAGRRTPPSRRGRGSPPRPPPGRRAGPARPASAARGRSRAASRPGPGPPRRDGTPPVRHEAVTVRAATGFSDRHPTPFGSCEQQPQPRPRSLVPGLAGAAVSSDRRLPVRSASGSARSRRPGCGAPASPPFVVTAALGSRGMMKGVSRLYAR